MGNNELATQTELARFLGVSQGLVSRYIQQGKIPPHCLVRDGRYTRIKVDCAVQELERNLDPTKRKSPAMEPDQEIDASWVKPYIDSIVFDLTDCDTLGARLGYALDTLSFIAEGLKHEHRERVDDALETIGAIFGCRRVRVDGSPGKLCLPIE